ANTGAATLIGPTGLTLGGSRSLSINADALYFANGANLYTLNTSSGVATLVGTTNGSQVGALIMEGGVLYGGDGSSGLHVDQLNIATGAATVGPNIFGTSNAFHGFAPYPETLLNDINFDGHVNAGDISAMMVALTNPTAYAATEGVYLQHLELV